jgi:hypothetical protein
LATEYPDNNKITRVKTNKIMAKDNRDPVALVLQESSSFQILLNSRPCKLRLSSIN